MTRAEAETEALRRWPETGSVFDRTIDSYTPRPGASPRYWVGRSNDGRLGPHIYGNGETWEEAFADAEGRKLDAEDVKLTPREAYDKITRIGRYLSETRRMFLTGAKGHVIRNGDVLNCAQQIIQLELRMRGEEPIW